MVFGTFSYEQLVIFREDLGFIHIATILQQILLKTLKSKFRLQSALLSSKLVYKYIL